MDFFNKNFCLFFICLKVWKLHLNVFWRFFHLNFGRLKRAGNFYDRAAVATHKWNLNFSKICRSCRAQISLLSRLFYKQVASTMLKSEMFPDFFSTNRSRLWRSQTIISHLSATCLQKWWVASQVCGLHSSNLLNCR